MATITPRDDDKGFAKFLQQIQAINVNLKESINKDESKLDQLNNIKKSATGISKDTDFKPVVKSLDKIDSVLEKSLKEQVSLRKIILKNNTIGFAAQEAIVPAAIRDRKVSPAPIVTSKQFKKTVEKVVPKRLGQDYLKPGKEDKEEEPLRFGRPSDFLEGAKERIGSIKSFFSGPVNKKEEARKENKNTFAEAYASSAKGTQVQKGNQRPSKESSIKAGEDLFDKIIKKEDEIKTLEEKIAKQTTAGFQPLKKDLKDIEKLQKDLTGIHTEAGMIPDESKTDTKPKVETRKKVVKEAAITGIEPSKDKIKTETEDIAKESKTDVELSKQQLQITKDSLTQLKAIRAALSPKKEKKDKASPGSKEVSIGKAASKGSITTTAASPAIDGASISPANTKSTLSTNPLAAAAPAVAAAEAPEAPEAGKGILDVASQALDLIPEGGKNPPGKPAGKAAKGIGGRILGGLGKAARFLGPVGAIAGAAYSGFEGYKNTGENFDLKEGQEATVGQKASSTLGGIASGATFGLLDEKTASQGIHKAGTAIGNFFGMGDKSAAVTPAGAAPSTGQAMAKASTENADMTRDVANQAPSSTSVVSTNVSNNNTTSYVPMKSVPRGEQGSNLDRYLSRTAVY